MSRLVDVLAEVFRSHGYRASSSGALHDEVGGRHPVSLWLEKDGRSVAVELWLDTPPPPPDALAQFDARVRAANVTGLFVNLGGPVEAAQEGIIVWGPEQLQVALGRAVLHETCRGVLPHVDPLEGPPRAPQRPDPSPEPAPEPALATATGPVFGPWSAEPDFEELPGRAADEASAGPASAEAPGDDPSAPLDFEALAVRADDGSSAAPEPAWPAAVDASGSSDFEELPGRADGAFPKGAHAAAPSGRPVASPSDFEELPGRAAGEAAANDGTEPASMPAGRAVSHTANFEELPGRSHAAHAPSSAAGRAPAADLDIPSRQRPAVDGGTRPPVAFELPPAFAEDGHPPAAEEAASSAVSTEPGVLRMQVGRRLVRNMVKEKLRTVRDDRLRLVPHYVFKYSADVLVDGRLDAEVKEGLVGVDAWMRRARVWTHSRQTEDPEADGAEVERLKLRLSEEDARRVVLQHLEALMGREVVQEEESDNWAVVVRRRVRLRDGDVRVQSLGVYWVPVWRLAGPDGSLEIDASTGDVLEEDVYTEQTDTQLL